MSVRNNPFTRNNVPPSAGPSGVGRPKSFLGSSSASISQAAPSPPSHARTQSLHHVSSTPQLASQLGSLRSIHSANRGLTREPTSASTTFAPSFIKTEDLRKPTDIVNGIEGESDFSGKKYVWLKDPEKAFIKGWVVEELPENKILVQCDDGSVSIAYWDRAPIVRIQFC